MENQRKSHVKRKKQFDYNEVFLKDSLYSKYKIEDYAHNSITNLLFFHPDDNTYNLTNTLDSYCPTCNKPT